MKDFKDLPLNKAYAIIFEDDTIRETTRTALTGGCIHEIFRIALTGEKIGSVHVVLKQARTRQTITDLLAESKSLLALRAVYRAVLRQNAPHTEAITEAITHRHHEDSSKLQYLTIPQPYGISTHHGYLLLEYLATKPDHRQTTPLAEEHLALGLAKLHLFQDWQSIANDNDPELTPALRQALQTLHPQTFGWHENAYSKWPHKRNFPPQKRWIDFFREYRLIPILDQTYRNNLLPLALRKSADRLLKRLELDLPEPPHASIVHGDLWSGNVMLLGGGAAALIDPAVHLSHHETDLALSELFGRRAPIFYKIYQELFPLEADYPNRVPLYNLYHLLNHLHLFGSSYLPAVAQTLNRYA